MTLVHRARAIAFAVAVLAVAAPAVPAFAHSGIETMDPAPGETLTEPPAQVRATFSEELDAASTLTVIGPDGQVEAEGGLDLDDLDHTSMRADVSLDPGRYTVRWTVVAEDGDETEDSWSFAIADASGQVPEVSGAQPADDGSEHTSPVLMGGLVAVALAGVVGLAAARRRAGP